MNRRTLGLGFAAAVGALTGRRVGQAQGTPDMTARLDLVYRWFSDVMSEGNADAIRELVSPQFITPADDPQTEDYVVGVEPLVQRLTGLYAVERSAYPDAYVWEVQETLDDDLATIAARGQFRTRVGGKSVSVAFTSWFRIGADDLITMMWINRDDVALARIIGEG